MYNYMIKVQKNFYFKKYYKYENFKTGEFNGKIC